MCEPINVRLHLLPRLETHSSFHPRTTRNKSWFPSPHSTLMPWWRHFRLRTDGRFLDVYWLPVKSFLPTLILDNVHSMTKSRLLVSACRQVHCCVCVAVGRMAAAVEVEVERHLPNRPFCTEKQRYTSPKTLSNVVIKCIECVSWETAGLNVSSFNNYFLHLIEKTFKENVTISNDRASFHHDRFARSNHFTTHWNMTLCNSTRSKHIVESKPHFTLDPHSK